jgi:hypothetical protein
MAANITAGQLRRRSQSLPSRANDVGFNLGAGPGGRDLPPARWPIVQEGLPDAIPVEACYLGWQDSLRNLASLVEPEINQ